MPQIDLSLDAAPVNGAATPRAGRPVALRAPVAWLCHLVRGATLAYAAVAVAVLIVAPIKPDWLFAEAGRAIGGTIGDVPLSLRLAAELPVGAGVVASIVMMVMLFRLFGRLAAGDLFAPATTRLLRAAAGWALAGLILDILARPIVSVILTLDRGPGQRLLVLGVDSQDLVNLIFTGTMLVLAHVMAQAGRLADDSATIV